MLFKNRSSKHLLHTQKIIGVDVNKDRFACSDGRVFYIKHFNDELGIPEMRRQLATLKEGTDDYNKLNQKIGRACRQAQRQRKRFYEEMVKEIVIPDTDAVGVENLDLKQMFEGADDKLFQDLYDIGFGIFMTEIQKYCREMNIPLVKVRQYEPSSQTCSVCETINTKLGKAKEWKCTTCGTVHDRDFNAALNIKGAAIRNLKKEKFKVINITPVTNRIPYGGFEACDFALEAKSNTVIALSDKLQYDLFERLKTLYTKKENIENHPYFSRRSLQYLLEQIGVDIGQAGFKPGSPIGDVKSELRWLLIQLGYSLEYYVENGKTPIPSIYFLKEFDNDE